ncbi:MAG: hypothetical protein ABIS27_05195 [Longimicrobiales bacterium]
MECTTTLPRLTIEQRDAEPLHLKHARRLPVDRLVELFRLDCARDGTADIEKNGVAFCQQTRRLDRFLRHYGLLGSLEGVAGRPCPTV